MASQPYMYMYMYMYMYICIDRPTDRESNGVRNWGAFLVVGHGERRRERERERERDTHT